MAGFCGCKPRAIRKVRWNVTAIARISERGGKTRLQHGGTPNSFGEIRKSPWQTTYHHPYVWRRFETVPLDAEAFAQEVLPGKTR
jgi:hypothetical protein